MVTEQDVLELQGLGNGARKLVPAADDGIWEVHWVNGKVRVDKYDRDVKIQLSARRVGGGAIPAPIGN